MSRFALTMAGNWKPATFLERGVAVPFTTPIIAQARCRPDKRGNVEMIVPNPSGGDGNYVMPLAAIANFCTPSLHDQFLLEQLETIEHITPAAIRTIASEAAMQGFAGRLAAKAAKQRLAESESLLMMNYLVLFAKAVQAAGDNKATWRNLNMEDPKIRARTKRLIGDFAPKLGMAPDKLLDELEAISRAVAFTGCGEPAIPSPATRQLDQLRVFTKTVNAWQKTSSELRQLPGLIVNSANLTIDQTEKAISRSRRLTEDVAKMMKIWRSDRKACLEHFGLADWMLDGWQHICALWQSVEEHDSNVKWQTIQTIAELVPLLPTEADKWLGPNTPTLMTSSQSDRRVRLNEDWRTGTVRINSREHQEQLRAYA